MSEDQEHYERQLEIASGYIKELQTEKNKLKALLPRVFEMSRKEELRHGCDGYEFDDWKHTYATLEEVLKAIEDEK